MTRDEDYWNGPGAVAVEHRDGSRETVTFDTRLEAETWLALLPWRQATAATQVTGDDDVADIASAILVGAAVLRPEDVASALSWN